MNDLDLRNKYYLDMTECLLCKQTYSGSVVVIDTNKIAERCLYRYRIPVELRSMIISYLFEDECVFKAAYQRILDFMKKNTPSGAKIGETIEIMSSCDLGVWYSVRNTPDITSMIVQVELYMKLGNRRIKPVKNTFIKYITQRCVGDLGESQSNMDTRS